MNRLTLSSATVYHFPDFFLAVSASVCFLFSLYTCAVLLLPPKAFSAAFLIPNPFIAKVPYLTKLAKSLRFSTSMKPKKPRISKLLVKNAAIGKSYANGSNCLVDPALFNSLSHRALQLCWAPHSRKAHLLAPSDTVILLMICIPMLK